MNNNRFSKGLAWFGIGKRAYRAQFGLRKGGASRFQGQESEDWEERMAGLTVDEWIDQLAPDLQGLLDARKVGKQTQADLAKSGVDNISMLSAVAINREALEKVAKDMLGIDVAGGGGDEQIRFAQLYLAWQAATKRVKVQDEMDAEATAQKEAKPVPPHEILALRQRFEAEYYKLKDAEIPAKSSLEDLFEQIDSGEFRPMALRHFGSRADDEEAEVGNLQLGKAGQVKIKKSRVETAPPSTLEELRAKVVLMANHYLFAKFRYPNKQLLKRINPFTFLDYLGYLTGKYVAQMESQTVDGIKLHKPSVKLLVNYEYQMRKEVVEEMNQGNCMAEELKKITKNSDIRERHFSTPLAVSSASQAMQAGWSNPDGSPVRVHPYGGGKGKGKGKKGKGKIKGKKGQQQQQLHSTTPDGRQICFAWNNQQEGCKGGCQRVHACRICLDPSHTTFQHISEEKKGTGAPQASWLSKKEEPPEVSHTRVLRVLYLFAGTDRRTSVKSVLDRFSQQFRKDFVIECEEWDICRGPAQDLLREEVQQKLLDRIRKGEFVAVLMSPPCASWSRAPWANRWGPRPLRTFMHPWGMPWLEAAKLEKVARSNAMIRFCFVKAWAEAADP